MVQCQRQQSYDSLKSTLETSPTAFDVLSLDGSEAEAKLFVFGSKLKAKLFLFASVKDRKQR